MKALNICTLQERIHKEKLLPCNLMPGNNGEPVLADHVERGGAEEHEAHHQGHLPDEPRQLSHGHTGSTQHKLFRSEKKFSRVFWHFDPD